MATPEVSAQKIIGTLQSRGGVRLKNTTVKGPLNLSLARLNRATIIADTVIFLDGVHIQAGLEVEAGPDSSRTIRIQMHSSQFRGPVQLDNTFYEISFEDCLFSRDVKFNGTFGSVDQLWLYGSTFEGDVAFSDFYPIYDLNLYDVLFKGIVDFFSTFVQDMNTTRLRTDRPINIRWSQFGDGWLEHSLSWAGAIQQPHRKEYVETGLMFWKNNFARLGYERDERKVRLELIRFRRKYLSPSQVEWWATYLLELPSGFGTSPYRPLWLGLLVIDLFAIAYWRKNAFVLKDAASRSYRPPVFVLSILYSLDTFLPLVSVTGIKSWSWDIAPDLRRLELLERLLGVAITALSAYSIGSYVI